jgi:hypothetical protein
MKKATTPPGAQSPPDLDKATLQKMTAQEIDTYFDDGGDISPILDMTTATQPNRDRATARVNLDLPPWAIAKLDQESDRIGVSRQALMKMWLIERLDAIARHQESDQREK